MENILPVDFWENIDAMYILLCNVSTYIILTAIPKAKQVATGWKRLISAVVAVLIGLLCIYRFHHEPEPVFYGFFLQFLMYDYVLKWFFKKIDGTPKKEEETPTDTPEEIEEKTEE